jgi:prepilin-type N-terminal cleavage/methylation domain-containing protein
LIIRRLNKVSKSQNGFTLLETLLALLISAVVGAAIISATNSIVNVNDRNIARTMAVKQVENAVHYINRDTQQSQIIEINGSNYWLRLTWTSWDDNNTINQVCYYFQNNNLYRSISFNDETPDIIRIAQNIVSKSATLPNYYAIPPEKSCTIVITAQVSSGSITAIETREVKIVPRPGS